MTLAATQIKNDHLTELEKSIIIHEGVSKFAYKDSLGYITIGVGKNIDERSNVGLTHQEIIYLMRNDIEECRIELSRLDFSKQLDSVRKDVMIELCYNIGIPKMMGFKNMRHYLTLGDYNNASRELLHSRWASQVGRKRSKEMANQLKTGKYGVG